MNTLTKTLLERQWTMTVQGTMSDSEVVAESVALTYASSVLIQVWTWTMDSPKANNKHNRLSSID
jgi:hypothetical protein